MDRTDLPGTALGLFVGKQLGIFAFTVAATRARLAPIPGGASLLKLHGVSTVAGIGFTVALLIASLAFPRSPEVLDQAKVGILVGSAVSGLVGAMLASGTSARAAVERDRRTASEPPAEPAPVTVGATQGPLPCRAGPRSRTGARARCPGRPLNRPPRAAT